MTPHAACCWCRECCTDPCCHAARLAAQRPTPAPTELTQDE